MDCGGIGTTFEEYAVRAGVDDDGDSEAVFAEEGGIGADVEEFDIHGELVLVLVDDGFHYLEEAIAEVAIWFCEKREGDLSGTRG